jgi:thioredoxin reductase (NADPH)
VNHVYDLAVVGSGLAGLSAAIQAGRMGLRTIVIGDDVTGGQVVNIELIENYPGFGAGVSGIDLVTAAQQQAASNGAEFAFGVVRGLTTTVRPFHVLGDGSGGGWHARAVVVATGGVRRTLGVPGETELIGRGVSECATCDGPLFCDQDVAVIGGGDSAMDEALVLARMCRTVHLITRGDDLTGLHVLRHRVAANPGITVTTGAEVDAIAGDGRVTAVRLGGGRELAVSGVFVHIGSDPATAPFTGAIPADGAGHLKVDLRMRTEVPGVFAAGECRWHSSRQLAAVAGDGVTAAIAAHEWLCGDGPPSVVALVGAPTAWAGQSTPGRATDKRLSSQVIEAVDLSAALETAHARGWTDGLPIVPPTPDRVLDFLDYVGARPDQVLGEFKSRGKTITMEKVAVNAAMAGCLPEHMPVVVALVRLTLRGGLSPGMSTSGWTNLFIVNGPIRDQLGMNYRGDVFGPGNRANASIGRAIALIHRNAFGSVGGAGNDGFLPVPVLDRSTLGQPGQYMMYHLVENEEDFPSLVPLHVTLGFDATDSVVTGMPVHWHAQIGVHEEKNAEEVLDTVSHHIVRQGWLMRRGSLVLVFPPELAGHLVDSGFTKADVGRYVFEHTTRSKKWMREKGLQTWSPASPRLEPVEPGDEDKLYAAAGRAEDVLSVVAGGPAGGFCHIIHPFPGMGFSHPAVSQKIEALRQ